MRIVCIPEQKWWKRHLWYSRSSLSGHTHKRTALLMAALTTSRLNNSPLTRIISLSGQFQLHTLFPLPKGVRLQEHPLYQNEYADKEKGCTLLPFISNVYFQFGMRRNSYVAYFNWNTVISKCAYLLFSKFPKKRKLFHQYMLLLYSRKRKN